MLTKNRFYTVGMAGLVLEAQAGGNGAAIRLAHPTGEKNQEWKLVNGPDKSCCKLVNAETKMVIDVALGGTQNGAWLHQWEDADVMTQEWTAQPTENGLYKLLSRASGRCMDAGLVVEEGTALKLWDDVDGASQKWKIQESRKNAKVETVKEATKEKPSVVEEVAVEEKAPVVEETTVKKEIPVVEEVVEKQKAPSVEFVAVDELLAETKSAPSKTTPAKKNNRKKNRRGRK